MNNIILFRKDQDTEEEFSVCKDIFKENVVEYRSLIPRKSIVWGRYSFLPYYEELEQELKLNGSYMINSYEQHRYVADIQNWYSDLKDYTPRTWFEWHSIPEGSYVVKGKTNSRKHEWNKRMFAPTKADVPRIANTLLDDSLINEQGLCVREYVPLKTYGTGINGLRFTNEWRFFCYKKQTIDFGYYWSHFDGEKPLSVDEKCILLIENIKKIVNEYINFYVVDLAQTESGEWIVIELNDASQSGLSDINSLNFYKKLKTMI